MERLIIIIQNSYIKWVLVVLCMLGIFGMSHLNSVRSWYLTGQILTTVTHSQEDLEGMDMDEAIGYYTEEAQSGDILMLRKMAHVVEFFALSLVLINALWSKQESGRGKKVWKQQKVMLVTLAIVLLYAAFDEAHQLLIPGRTGDVKDVLIDMTGGILGVVFVWYVVPYFSRRVALQSLKEI